MSPSTTMQATIIPGAFVTIDPPPHHLKPQQQQQQQRPPQSPEIEPVSSLWLDAAKSYFTKDCLPITITAFATALLTLWLLEEFLADSTALKLIIGTLVFKVVEFAYGFALAAYACVMLLAKGVAKLEKSHHKHMRSIGAEDYY